MRNESAKKADLQRAVSDIKSIMTNLKLTLEQAMDALGIPQTDRSIYMGLVGEKNT